MLKGNRLMTVGSEFAQQDQVAPPAFPRKNRTAEDAERASQTLAAIRKFVHDSFEEGIDFDVIPGTKRRTLLKPGAEKVALFFDSRPSYFIVATNDLGGGHVEYIVKCEFREFGTAEIIAEGDGSCSTMEKKYRWRSAQRLCPSCSKAAIIKGKQEYGGGWVCFEKKGGCKSKYKDDDKRITDQQLGDVENPDIHDERNTVLKMAEKRACVSAGLAAGCLSGFFTQDMEEKYEAEQREEARARAQESPAERSAQQEGPAPAQSEEPPPDGSSEAGDTHLRPRGDEPGVTVHGDPTRPKASLQKILSLAFRDDTDQIKKFMAEATAHLFGAESSLNALSKDNARTLLEAVQKGRIKIPTTP
jgi:hypothetical protein